jgi:serine/threonine protein kinase/WD40 repeat protein/tetratricopeptide (TPR) repeat protein
MNTSDRNLSGASEDVVGPVMESFLARYRRGERPALTDLVKRHPELADELLEMIPALVELERIGGATGSFLGNRPQATGTDANHPRSLGDYRILRKIGGGGMGVVYEAEHESLKSRVALKVMHPRFRADSKYLRRFHIEARAAAGLHHTNIVSVFDYGEQDGVCFYAMQYIRGQPLDAVLNDLRRLRHAELALAEEAGHEANGSAFQSTNHELRDVVRDLMTGEFPSGPLRDPDTPTLRVDSSVLATPVTDAGVPGEDVSHDDSCPAQEILPEPGWEPGPEDGSFTRSSLGGATDGRYFLQVARICSQVADALEYAHKAGVLHRDIKPPNLLLDPLGNVWVTDFGLAKLEEGEDATQSRDLVGTLRYMAPERFRGVSDRRGDIYALGATLYELITLRPVFEGHDQVQLIDRIAHEPPVRPRLIDRNVPRDLETIVLKALAKDPKDRFATAGELARELRQFVGGHPIGSRPISSAERFWRWCKREPWLAGANVAAALLTTLLAIGGVTAAYVYRSKVDELEIEQRKTRLEHILMVEESDKANHAAREAQEASLKANRSAIDAYIAQADAGRFSRRAGQRFKSLDAIRKASQMLDTLKTDSAFERDRDTLRDLAIAALALPDLRVSRTIGSITEKTRNFDIDPAFERYAFSNDVGDVFLRRADTDAELFQFPSPFHPEHEVEAAAKPSRAANPGNHPECWPQFDPTGRYLVLNHGSDHFQVWNLAETQPTRVPHPEPLFRGQGVCFHPDGKSLLYTRPDGRIERVDLATGQTEVLPSDDRKVSLAAIHPQGNQLAALIRLGAKTEILVRAFDDPKPLARVEFDGPIVRIAFSPDGLRVVLCGLDRIYLWQPGRTGQPPLALPVLPNGGGGIEVAFNHRGDLLASSGWDGMTRIWDPRTGRLLVGIHGLCRPRFSADDRYLGIGNAGSKFEVWEVASGRELRTMSRDPRYPGNVENLAFEGQGRVLALRTSEGLQLWDTEALEPLARLSNLRGSDPGFQRDGSLLTFGIPGLLRWPIERSSGRWTLGPPRMLHDSRSTGGNVAGSRLSARVVWGKTLEHVQSLTPHFDVRYGAISPDGQKAATIGFHGTSEGVKVWDTRTGRLVATLAESNMSYAVFGPDNRWLVTSRGKCKLWDMSTWRLIREVDPEGGQISLSPDGSILTTTYRNLVRLYDTKTWERLATLEAPTLNIPVRPTWTPDGSRLALIDPETHDVLIWNLDLVRAELAELGLDWDSTGSTRRPVEPPTIAPPQPLRFEVKGADDASLKNAEQRYRIEKGLRDVRNLFLGQLATPEEYHMRSHDWQRLGQWPLALSDAERALALGHDDAHLFGLLGNAAFQCGDATRSLAAYRKAVELAPHDPEALNNLAWVLLVMNRGSPEADHALEMAREAVASQPKNASYVDTLALALMRTGRDAEAAALIAAGPENHPWTDLTLAVASYRLGQYDRARQARATAEQWRAKRTHWHPRVLALYRELAAEADEVLGGLPREVFATP